MKRATFPGGITLTAIAQVVAVGEISLSGIVETVTGDGLTVRDADGTRHQVRVQGKDRPDVALTDGTLLAAPVEATVRPEFPAAGLKPGARGCVSTLGLVRSGMRGSLPSPTMA